MDTEERIRDEVMKYVDAYRRVKNPGPSEEGPMWIGALIRAIALELDKPCPARRSS